MPEIKIKSQYKKWTQPVTIIHSSYVQTVQAVQAGLSLRDFALM
jgi:hypothetical protein